MSPKSPHCAVILTDSVEKMPEVGSLWHYVEIACTENVVENKNPFI